MRDIYILFTFLLITACNTKEKADTIFTNGNIYSVNENFDIYESFAVKDSKIIAIGTSDEITKKYEATETIDLKGKFVYPGFNDAHCHFFYYGLNLKNADLTGTQSFDEITKILKNHSEQYKTEWITGRGWDQNDWKIKEYPINSKLNELFPETPVFIGRIDGHAGIANNKALEIAGITANTKIDGGDIILINGKPSGVLIDNAMDLVSQHIPKANKQEKITALLKAQENCFAVGLTSVSDAGLNKNDILLIDSLQKAGKLKMRIDAWLADTEENMVYFVKNGVYATDFLRIGTIKLYTDGALGSRGAKMKEEYTDDAGNTGLIVTPPEHLQKVCKIAYDNNYQIATHAIGDKANNLILNIYGKILKKKNDRRWRVEHCQVISSDDFQKFADFSITPSVQPTHATSDMYWAEERIGNERIKGAYAYAELLKQNGYVAAGSDFPIEDINPLFGFYAAVSRKDQQNYPDNGFNTENALTRKQALKAMTIWAARASFCEEFKGSIEIGKAADFVILNEDLLHMSEANLYKTKVLETWLNGSIVFESPLK